MDEQGECLAVSEWCSVTDKPDWQKGVVVFDRRYQTLGIVGTWDGKEPEDVRFLHIVRSPGDWRNGE